MLFFENCTQPHEDRTYVLSHISDNEQNGNGRGKSYVARQAIYSQGFTAGVHFVPKMEGEVGIFGFYKKKQTNKQRSGTVSVGSYGGYLDSITKNQNLYPVSAAGRNLGRGEIWGGVKNAAGQNLQWGEIRGGENSGVG